MFKDQGNSTFEAQLEYQDDVTREKYKQSVAYGNEVQNWQMENYPVSLLLAYPITIVDLLIISLLLLY
jgi:hypothetical protein